MCMAETYKYKFNVDHYDVEAMMESGFVISFDYIEEGGITYMIIHTSTCCDHWFA